jgi:hypothetical protein
MAKEKEATPIEVATEQNTDNQIIPQEQSTIQDYNIDGFLEMRSEFIEKVNKTFVEGRDYHVIKNKKSMAKGGAEKIASIFGWSASFRKDSEALEMLGDMKGTVAFVCSLTKQGNYIGEGRGASTLSANNNDPNKTLKMAQKSAFIDAVLRASGLSDFFTQDLEDMNPAHISQPQNNQSASVARPASQNNKTPKATKKQLTLINRLIKQKGVEDKVTPEIISKLTIASASALIERMNHLPNKPRPHDNQEDELPVIQIEEQFDENDNDPNIIAGVNVKDIPF